MKNRETFCFVLIAILFVLPGANIVAQTKIQPVRNDTVPWVFNHQRIIGNDSLVKIKFYPGEYFEIRDSHIVWRDSVSLNPYHDTIFIGYSTNKTNDTVYYLRKISQNGTHSLMKNAKIKFEATWDTVVVVRDTIIKLKPKDGEPFQGNKWEIKVLLKDTVISANDATKFLINSNEKSPNNISISSISDSCIMFIMPQDGFDSCYIINETKGHKLCKTVYPGDSIMLSLMELEISGTNDTCTFRIHPSGALPIYFTYPSDLQSQPEGKCEWLHRIWSRFSSFLTGNWWIGWVLFLCVIIASTVTFILFQKKKKNTNENNSNHGNQNVDGRRSTNPIDKINIHLPIIRKEIDALSSIIQEKKEGVNELSNPIVPEEKVTGMKEKKWMDNRKNGIKSILEKKKPQINDACLDEDVQSSIEKTVEAFETLKSTILEEYEESLRLKEEIADKEASLKDTIQEEKRKIELEANKKVKEVQKELEDERASTAQKVKDAEDKVKTELTKVQAELKAEKDNTAQKVKDAEDKVKTELTKVQAELKAEKDNTAQKVKDAEYRVKKDLTKAQEDLKAEKASTAQKVKDAEEKVKKELTKVQEDLKAEKASTAQKIDKARKEEQEAKRKAVQLKQDEIDQLKLDQKFYLANFTRMEFAQPYATLLKQLINVANEVEKSANAIIEGDKLEDAYYLYRAQSKYNLNLSKIDKSAFLSEIEMIAKGQLIFNSSAASKYDPKDKEGSIKKYFFINYLEKYFNALVVFNETLSGLCLFDQKLKEKDVATFANLCAKINDIAAKLGIEITTVHLGEQNKYSDVQILERVDVGLPKNSIVDIENCKVSMKGGRNSADKIKIKVQL